MSLRKLMLIVVFVLLSLSYAVVAESEEDEEEQTVPDGIYFVRPESADKESVDFKPEFVPDEPIVFYSCMEGSPRVYNSVYCKNNPSEVVELDTYPWKDSCHISVHNTSDLDCSELIVMAEYEVSDEILRWEEEITVTDVQSIPYILLDTQDEDGGWGDAVSTAWVIWTLAEFGDGGYKSSAFASQVEDGLSWLKENRHPEDKCWPKDECNIRVTSEVLAALNEANLTQRSDWLRIVHDASIWLSLQQNLFDLRDPSDDDTTDETWTASISGENWTDGDIDTDYTSCLIEYADEYDETIQIVFDETYDLEFTPIHDERFTVLCSPNSLPITIRNNRDELVFNSTTGNVTYRIPGACWNDREPWLNCDVKTTNFASDIHSLDSVRRDLGKDWLKDSLEEGEVGSYFDTDDKFFDTAWFLYNRYGQEDNSDEISELEEDIVSWLMYEQNNDGSWGNESLDFDANLEQTAMTSMALSEVNNGSYSEFIKDANVWISDNRPSDGWDTVKKDALGFLSFSKSAKPFIIARDGLVRMTRNRVDVELYNPSSFDFDNLDFELEGDIEEYLEVDGIGSLASDYFKYIGLELVENPEMSVHGVISVLNDGDEIGRIPVLIQQVPEIDIYPDRKEYSIYNGQGSAKFDVEMTEGVSLDCRLKWEDPSITSRKRFSISEQDNISTDIVLSEVRNQRKEYEGSFECIHDDMNLSMPFTINTVQFEETPFTVDPDTLNLTSLDDELSYTIYNNVDMPITVNSEFETEDPYMMISSPKVEIDAHDRAQVTLKPIFSEEEIEENVDWSNSIDVQAYGRSERIDMSLNLQESRAFSFTGLFFTFVVVFGLMAGTGYLAYSKRSTIISALPDSVKSKLPENIVSSSMATEASSKDDTNHPMEKKVKAKNFVHLAEVIKIMKGLGKDDDEISKKLENEGYSKAEVNELFERVQDELDAEQTLGKEERFMKMMKDLDSDAGAVRTKLKQDGFTDSEIKEAFKQAEEEIIKKRTDLDKKLKDTEKYNLEQDDAKDKKKKKKEGESEEEGKQDEGSEDNKEEQK
ncbi:MAG: hypothetical protein ACLFNK_01255 [Candidatus Woesearchaeota archaeon]